MLMALSASYGRWAPVVDPLRLLGLRRTGHQDRSMAAANAVICLRTERFRLRRERGADVQVAGGKRRTMNPLAIHRQTMV